MNIIIGARGQPKKFNVPHSSQDQSNDNDTPQKFWTCEKLTDCQQVRDSGEGQRSHEVRPTPIAEVE
jgi:hypothetical protein